MDAFKCAALMACVVLVAAGCGGGEPAPDAGKKAVPAQSARPAEGDGALDVRSPAFKDGGEIPTQYTCDGEDMSPPLAIEGVPDEASSLALVVDDPDAPGGTFVHWVMWNIPPDVAAVAEDEVPEGVTGTNDFGDAAYGGPCPPEGDGPHTYRFKVYALDVELDLERGADADELSHAMEGHVLARGTLTGEYARQ